MGKRKWLKCPVPSAPVFSVLIGKEKQAVCSYSSRRDFNAEAQRGKRTLRKKKRRLNTKAPRHKGQIGLR